MNYNKFNIFSNNDDITIMHAYLFNIIIQLGRLVL
jgi:hypothetical protein